ncbi:MAG TPA: co-chaperone GroES [Bacteroidales bacterium]|nr:co-chaperone GroES [Bacteroidales bacterium]
MIEKERRFTNMLKPLQDFVLIETIPFEEVTESGLVLTNPKHVPHQDGLFVSAGNTCPDEIKAIEKGTKLIFRNGQEAKRWMENGKEYVIVRQEWIHGIYE